MYTTPIVLLVGQAGSGKDTIAGFLVKNHGAIAIAQADPMKRLAAHLFEFTEDQLWGPSESRNARDERFADPKLLDDVLARVEGIWTFAWVRQLNPDAPQPDVMTRHAALLKWVESVVKKGKGDRFLTPRYVLQTLGTEWGRAQGQDIWSNYTIKMARKLLAGGYRYDRTKGLVEDSSFMGPDRVVITDGRFRNEVINVRAIGGAAIKIESPSIDTSSIEAAGVKGHQSEKEQGGMPTHWFTGFLLNDKSKGLNAAELYTKQLVKGMDGNYFYAGYFNDSWPGSK